MGRLQNLIGALRERARRSSDVAHGFGRRSIAEPLEARIAFDANDQLSEAQTVSFGTTVSGESINPAVDVDMYRVHLNAGQTVAFDVDTPNSGLDSYLRLFNASGQQVAYSDDDAAPGESGEPYDSYRTYTASSTGWLYAGVSGYRNSAYNATSGANDTASSTTGAFNLVVSQVGGGGQTTADSNDQLTEAQTVSFGTTVTGGTIDPATDVDMYRIYLNAGQSVAFDVDTPNSNVDSYLRIFNGSGQQTASSDDDAAPGETGEPRDAYTTYTAPAAGWFYAGISGFGNSTYNAVTGTNDLASSTTGTFNLTVTQVSATWRSPLDASYYVSATFEEQNYFYVGGVSKTHLGRDLAVAAGTAVYPIAGGEVIDVQNDGEGAKVVFIRHQTTGGPVVGIYGHVTTAVRQGQRVTTADVIGRVAVNHLHFGLAVGSTFTAGSAYGADFGWGRTNTSAYRQLATDPSRYRIRNLPNNLVDPELWLADHRPV